MTTEAEFEGVPDDELAAWHPSGDGCGMWQIDKTPVPWLRLVGVDGREPEAER